MVIVTDAILSNLRVFVSEFHICLCCESGVYVYMDSDGTRFLGSVSHLPPDLSSHRKI